MKQRSARVICLLLILSMITVNFLGGKNVVLAINDISTVELSDGFAEVEAEAMKYAGVDRVTKSTRSDTGGEVLAFNTSSANQPAPDAEADIEFIFKPEAQGNYEIWVLAYSDTDTKDMWMMNSGQTKWTQFKLGNTDRKYIWCKIHTYSELEAESLASFKMRAKNGYFRVDKIVIAKAGSFVPVASINVTGQGEASGVTLGESLQMLAAVIPGDAMHQKVLWSVTGSGASIDANGLLAATAEGTVTVRASSGDGSQVYGERQITVALPKVTYHGNGGTGEGPETQFVTPDGIFMVADNTFTPPQGRIFSEWNTSSDGSGTAYTAGSDASMPGASLSLYAIWEPYEATQHVYEQGMIDKAVEEDLTRYNMMTGDWGYGLLKKAPAMYLLALMAFENPDMASSTGIKVSDRLLQHIRNIITGGREPSAKGATIGWADNQAAQTLALIKHIPAVWNQLTDTEKAKCDFIMKCLAISGNWYSNTLNNPLVTLDQANIFGKNYNPNFIEGNVGALIGAYMYFGGAQQVNAILAAFDWDEYIAKCNEYGFINIKDTFTRAGKTLMESGGTDAGGGTGQGVRIPFTYEDLITKEILPYDPFILYESLAARMYDRKDGDSITDRGYMENGKIYDVNGILRGFILDGTESPWNGHYGICHEFLSSDAGGVRSSLAYVYDGLRNNVVTRSTLQALGYWPDSRNHAAAGTIERNMNVGMEDFIYKAIHGYSGWKIGTPQVYQNENGLADMGYWYIKQIWTNYLKEGAPIEVVPPSSTRVFVLLNGKGVAFEDQEPFVDNGAVLVPVKTVFEAMGAVVEWNEEAKALTATREDIRLILQSGSEIMTKNGQSISLGALARLEDGILVAPVGAVAGFEAEFTWDSDNSRILIADTYIHLLEWNGIAGSFEKGYVTIEDCAAVGYDEPYEGSWSYDGDFTTCWAKAGDGIWIVYDFGEAAGISSAHIAWRNNHQRRQTFDIEISLDGKTWIKTHDRVLSAIVASRTLERFAFPEGTEARYVRITGYGNTANTNNTIDEIKFESGDVMEPEGTPPYSLTIGEEVAGGAGRMRTVSIGGSEAANLSGKYLVVQLTQGAGDDAKVSVVMISATGADTVVSYPVGGTRVEVWLTSGMPELSAEDMGIAVHAYGTAE